MCRLLSKMYKSIILLRHYLISTIRRRERQTIGWYESEVIPMFLFSNRHGQSVFICNTWWYKWGRRRTRLRCRQDQRRTPSRRQKQEGQKKILSSSVCVCEWVWVHMCAVSSELISMIRYAVPLHCNTNASVVTSVLTKPNSSPKP